MSHCRQYMFESSLKRTQGIPQTEHQLTKLVYIVTICRHGIKATSFVDSYFPLTTLSAKVGRIATSQRDLIRLSIHSMGCNFLQ